MQPLIRIALLTAVGIWSASACLPGQSPQDHDLPPEDTDIPRQLPKATVTERAMVAAAHPLAARAGAEIMKAGGNAIDATVAVQMVLNVVEPQSSGIGGGCFILYYDAKQKAVHCIDGREETPAEAQRSDYLDSQGEVLADAKTGGLPVGVPGTVAAMWLAHAKWGKLPIHQVLQPAIRLAEDGIGVTPRLQSAIRANQRRFLRFPSSRAAFLLPDGSVPELGHVLKQPDLARTLRLLADHGPTIYYEGEVAADIVKSVREAPYQPGRVSAEDLRNYRAVLREPVRFQYRGREIVSMPPPSSGGITVGIMLGILENEDIARTQPGSIEEVRLLARAGAAAFADRNAYLGDQDWSPHLDMRALLQRGRIAKQAAIAKQTAPGQRFPEGPKPLAKGMEEVDSGQGPGRNNPHEGPDTTHFSIVDADRNVVACTTTIEGGMGSGLVVAGRGFLLNNELTDLNLDLTDGPNALDNRRMPRRTALDAKDTIGGKRPRSSMTPVIVFKDGQPILTAGSPGGTQIIGVVGQILVNVLDHQMDMQQAINAPRLSSRNSPIGLEVLYPNRAQLQNKLRADGWQIQQRGEQVWGGAHGIRLRADGKLEGGADPRREGAVRGW